MSDRLKAWIAWSLMLGVAAWAFVFFRATYNHDRRLRVVEPGKYYRCGQLTADGFREAVRRYNIRTIVNVQDDVPDPKMPNGTFKRGKINEIELCKELGVRYVWLAPDLVHPEHHRNGARPAVIEQFLRVCDDPSVYPILLHCKAGLHRTGILSAIYRMEYNGWSRESAFRELRAHGFGDWACTADNEYITQYVLSYTPRPRRSAASVALDHPAN
ncbi:MAG: tyrosine-protein phosphatase [Gemmataceae bacterium]